MDLPVEDGLVAGEFEKVVGDGGVTDEGTAGKADGLVAFGFVSLRLEAGNLAAMLLGGLCETGEDEIAQGGHVEVLGVEAQVEGVFEEQGSKLVGGGCGVGQVELLEVSGVLLVLGEGVPDFGESAVDFRQVGVALGIVCAA